MLGEGVSVVEVSETQFLVADMLPVRDACCQYLDKHMDENNSLGIQNFAEMHACQDLQKKARNYSLKMFTEV